MINKRGDRTVAPLCVFGLLFRIIPQIIPQIISVIRAARGPPPGSGGTENYRQITVLGQAGEAALAQLW